MPITLDGTTGIDAPLGTAASPSYGNTTATTTGLYFPTSTTLGLSTNGTAAVTINDSQNVGIGSAPNSRLTIDSGAAGQMSTYNSTNANGGYITGYSSSTAVWDIGTAKQAFNTGTSTDFGINVRSGFLGFGTATTERMRIDSSGNVGIGTLANAATKLQVQGTIYRTAQSNGTTGTPATEAGMISGSGGVSVANPSGLYFWNAFSSTNASWLSLRVTNSSGTTSDAMLIDSSGNVGIGLTSSTEKFEVSGSVNASTASSANFSTGNQRAFMDYVPGSTTARFGHLSGASGSTTGAMAMFTNGTERMRITSTGAISVGSSGTATGTSGQVLTSAGSGASPTWTTISTSASGTLIRAPQILTSGTSYTTPSNCTAIYVELIGAGGGGGRTNSSTWGGCGGGGGYLTNYLSVSPSTAYTYAIGSGGSAAASNNTNGGNGGNTTLTVGATTYTASGGSGGSSSSGNANGGGTTNGSTFSITGGKGAEPRANTATPGSGGTPPIYWIFGGGTQANNATAASNYGCGGGGGPQIGSATAGTQGIIRIWEYT